MRIDLEKLALAILTLGFIAWLALGIRTLPGKPEAGCTQGLRACIEKAKIDWAHMNGGLKP